MQTGGEINKILNPFYEIMPLKGVDMYEAITSYFEFEFELQNPEDIDEISHINTLRERQHGIMSSHRKYKLSINGEDYEINYEITPILYKYLQYRCMDSKWLKANKLLRKSSDCYYLETHHLNMLLFSNNYWSGLTSNQEPDKRQNYAQIDKDIYNPLIYIPKICLALIDVPKLAATTNLPEHIQKNISNFMIHKTKLFKFAKRYWECLISIMMHFNCDTNPYNEYICSGGNQIPLYVEGILSTYGMNFTAFYMYHYCNVYISEKVKSRIKEIGDHPELSDSINKEFIQDEPVYNIKFIEEQYKYGNIPWRSFKNMVNIFSS
jgi:hypothetical protein